LEAVATETPARSATSRIVGVLPAIVRSLQGVRRGFAPTFSPGWL
jgi:aminoglycoside N3'-acetyltransferase